MCHISPETMKSHVELKFKNRYAKRRPHFITEIFEFFMFDHTESFSNKLFINLYNFLKQHLELFQSNDQSCRFQLLFHNYIQHWTACDVFIEKRDCEVKNVNIFLLDAVASYPDELLTPISSAFYIFFGEEITHYLLGGIIQRDKHNCGTFALDHLSQISLLNPNMLYIDNFPSKINQGYRERKKVQIYGREPIRCKEWNFIESYSLPLPLLRNIQNRADIEILRTERPNELNLTVFRNPKPWNPPELVTRGFNDYVNIEEFYSAKHEGSFETNTAIKHKYEQYSRSLRDEQRMIEHLDDHLSIPGPYMRDLTFEEKFRMIYFEEDMGIERREEGPEGYYQDRWQL